MELDELKGLWQETEKRLAALEPALRAQRRLAKLGLLDRMRSKLRLVHLVLWYEAAFGVLATLLAGSYLFDHLGEPRFAIPAAVLHVCAIATLGLAVGQIVALGQLDAAGPVVQIQRRLAQLRVLRSRSNRWLLFSAPLLWALLVVVVPHGLIGLDVYRAFGLPWIVGNLVFGIAVLAAAAWATRRFPGAALLAWLGDDLTGRRIVLASGFLDEVEAFEKDGTLPGYAPRP